MVSGNSGLEWLDQSSLALPFGNKSDVLEPLCLDQRSDESLDHRKYVEADKHVDGIAGGHGWYRKKRRS